MSIVKMKKVQLVALNAERNSLLHELQRLGCVELRPTEAPEGFLSPVIGGNTEEQIRSLRQQQSDTSEALKHLKKYAYEKSGLFAEKELISETDFFADIREEAQRAAGSILEAVQSLNQLLDNRNNLIAQAQALLLWRDLPVPLETRETHGTRIFIGSIPVSRSIAELSQAFEVAGVEIGLRGSDDAVNPPAAEDSHLPTSAATRKAVSADVKREKIGILAVCMKNDVTKAETILHDFGFEGVPGGNLKGTAAENLTRIGAELDEAELDEKEIRDYLKECGQQRRLLKLWYDRLTMELDAAEAKQKLLVTERAFALTGWVDEPHIPQLETLLEKYCCAWELRDPQEGEKVPVRLQNNRITSPLNMVTEMYSLPQYTNVDPNPLIMPFYCVFFGMMFNDLGYGLVFIILSLIVQKKYRLQRGMKNMMQLMLECGITTALFGLMTGSFFGDAIPQIASLFGKTVTVPYLISPLEDPLLILIISLVLGGIQIIFGMGVKAYILIRDGKPWDAVMDVGSWWLLFAGVAIGVLGGTWLVAIAGVLALILTQGRAKPTIPGKIVGGIASLYDITSYFSDILSYSRIMALMLAGGIVASIVNVLGGLFGNIFLFIPIFIIGHAFNIGINVIGTYVHAARLQYLEFFGKFYEDGGKAFRPLEVKTKYYDVIKEDTIHG